MDGRQPSADPKRRAIFAGVRWRRKRNLEAAISELNSRLDWLDKRTASLEGVREAQSRNVEELKGLAAVDAVSRWIRHAPLRSRPLISVVLPTHRPGLLRRAVKSVLDQRYDNWELLVVANGDRAAAREVVEAAADPKIHLFEIPSAVPGVARNTALDAARGELIAYLDDDNFMDSEWLYAVAWAFEQRPDVDVLYGAFVIDDRLRVSKESAGALPWTFLNRWDRAALQEGNLADMSAIAHRAGLPEGRFYESIRELGDWDLLVRLTADKDPLVLPAVACYYTTDAPDRVSMGPTHDSDMTAVRARAAAAAERATTQR
jgi:Glycosyl transferase family 2